MSNEKKKVGYEWWLSMGAPTKIVAPMVDASELAFRQLTRKHGAELVYTQMFNSNVFVRDHTYREENFETCPGDRPLIVQFCGNDPETLLAAAKMVEDQCDAVDINLGCPQGIARRGHYGAFLMEELDLLHEMVSTLAKGLKVPVTCKTRIYKDFDRSLRLCETLVNAGASMITIHGRTREEKGQLVKAADWETIRRIKEHFRGRVPVIANGGIESLQDYRRCLIETGCDGVMSSEGILENPSIFDESHNLPSQIEMAYEYLEQCQAHPVLHYRTIRSHLQRILYRFCSIHTELRDKIGLAREIHEFSAIVDDCRHISLLPENSCINYDAETWYKRHRNPANVHSGSMNAKIAMDTNKNGLLYYACSDCNDMEEDDPLGFSIFG
jgi:tRNA-dihydrouridine synthase 1